MSTEQKYSAPNSSAIISNAFEETALEEQVRAQDECNEALCNLFAKVSPAFANMVLFNLQQGFLKTGFLDEIGFAEETLTLFSALEVFFRVYNRAENQDYIKELTEEMFEGSLTPAL